MCVSHSQPQQLDLLCRVLTAGLDEAGVEVGAKDKDEEELAEVSELALCVCVCVCVIIVYVLAWAP